MEAQQKLLAELGPLIGSLDDPVAEGLVPQLRPFLWEDERGGVWLKHPWVNTMMPFVNHSNKVFGSKFSMMREYLGRRDLYGYLFVVVERPWRFDVLNNWWERDKLSRAELRELLPHVWTDVEFPGRNLNDPLALFRDAGFVTDAEEAWEALPDPVPVHRGGYQEGISWTLSERQAKWFASRFTLESDEHLPVWSGSIQKDRVFGYFEGRGEEEVVLDPYMVELI